MSIEGFSFSEGDMVTAGIFAINGKNETITWKVNNVTTQNPEDLYFLDSDFTSSGNTIVVENTTPILDGQVKLTGYNIGANLKTNVVVFKNGTLYAQQSRTIANNQTAEIIVDLNM